MACSASRAGYVSDKLVMGQSPDQQENLPGNFAGTKDNKK